MKIDVMRQPLSLTLVLFGLLAAGFCARFFFWPQPVELSVGAALPIENLLNRFSAAFPLPALGLSMLLAFHNGLVLSRILSRHMVLNSRTYIPITLYLVISCGVWFAGADLAAAAAAFLLVRATEHFLGAFMRRTTFDITFRGALLLGLIPLIYPPGAVYMVMVPLGLTIVKRTGREIVTALVGALLPALVYAYVMWIMDYGFGQTFVSFLEQLTTPAKFPTMEPGATADIIRLVCMGLVALLTMSGLAGFAIFSGKMRTRARTIFVYFLALTVVGCTSFFFPAANIGDLMLLAVPLVMIIPAAFAQFPGWFTGIAYTLLLLSVAALNACPFLFA